MRKVLWCGVVIAFLAAVGVYWGARWVSQPTEAPRTPCSAGMARHNIPEDILYAFRELTTPGFVQQQAPGTGGKVEVNPVAEEMATPAEPVEVIRVEPWSEELAEAVRANLIEGSQPAQATPTTTSDAEEGELVVTTPAQGSGTVAAATALVLPMPYAEEDQDKVRPTTTNCSICDWLLEVFRSAVEQAAGPPADRVMPRIEDEEEEMSEEENEEEIESSTRPDHGCPDYHRYHRGCPYMQGCPYPYHAPRPAWQPAGPNRAKVQGPRETPMQEPAHPTPTKPRRLSRATLVPGGIIDTMEYRPGDGPDYRFHHRLF